MRHPVVGLLFLSAITLQLANAGLFAQALQAAPPTFRAAGPRDATAPSGYSDGVTDERIRTTSDLIAMLQRQALLKLLPLDGGPLCTEKDRLLQELALHPRNVLPNLQLGLLYLRHGQPASAIPLLTTAGSLAPDNPQPQLSLTVAYIENRDDAEAGASLAKLRATHTDPAIVAQLSGVLFADAGRAAESDAAYSDAVRLRPTADTIFARGLELLSAGESAKARSVFMDGLKGIASRSESDGQLWLGLGMADILQGAQQAAAEEFLKAATHNPRDLVSSTLLAAWVQPESHISGRALAAIKNTATQLPESALARYNVATLLARMTRQNRSVAQVNTIRSELNRAIAINSGLAAAHFELGKLDAEQGDKAQAIGQIQQAVHLQEGVAEWHYWLFREFEAAGQPEAAREELTTFRRLQSTFPKIKDESRTFLRGISGNELQADDARCLAEPH